MDSGLRELFHELAGLPPGEREKQLAGKQLSPEMRAELESLFHYDSDDPSLAECVVQAADEVLCDPAAARPRYCGPYRLIRLLGRGGMGAVYLGERSDGEIRQQVAIKLLPGGNDRSGWRERFLQERQLLASLNHPSIVRVLDAGRSDDGGPYLVMEYIEGAPIDAYAERLEARARLHLFLQVCDAVSYAHRNLVIHRDLKPSNILVDASGQPKLLDFGIAKMLDGTGDATLTMERLLTPEYASPEQVRGSIQTTATDIYSLAAILYKLLTGSSPHAFGKHTKEEMIAAVGTEEPAPASRINAEVPRDLDYILGKALRKEAEERYPSVEALAEDVRAFLDCRPVRARSGNVWYRARKFARRYWIPSAAAAMAVASLAAGLVVSIRERNLAVKRFREVQEIANDLFRVERDINTLPGATAARERIVKTSLRYLEGLYKDAGSDLELRSEIAGGYRKVAEVQGVFRGTNLGHPEEAQSSLQKAESLYRGILKTKPKDRQALRNLIETIDLQSRIDYAARDLKQMDVRTRELQSLLEAYQPLAAGDSGQWSFLATTYDSMGIAVTELGRIDEGIAFALRSTEYRRRIARQAQSADARGGLANSLLTYARACRTAGRLDEALPALNESVSLLQGILAEDPLNYKIRLNLANTLIAVGRVLGDADMPSLGRVNEATGYFERGLRIGREVMASDAKEVMVRYNQSLGDWRLGDAVREKDPARALEAYDEAIGILREERAGNFSRDIPYVNVLAESTFALRKLKRETEARLRLKEAALVAGQYRNPVSQSTIYCDEAISRAEAAWALAEGRAADAVRLHRAFLAETEATKVPGFDAFNDLGSAFTMARRYRLVADALRALGKDGEAAQAEKKRGELVQFWKQKLPGVTPLR